MKNIVVFDEYNEIDFKPSDLLRKYMALTKKDVEDILVRGGKLLKSRCPACRSAEAAASFTRFGLDYVECLSCGTLYVSSRPGDEAIERYYKTSDARKFWRDEFSKATGNKRREKIIKPRFQWILESTGEYLPEARSFFDISTVQYGYIDELLKESNFNRKVLIDPFLGADAANYSPRIEVINTPFWKMECKADADVVSIFEVADRTADVDRLFTNLRLLLRKGGLCFMTAILASGFDIQTLWENAENIYPPDRLNVFSTEGLKALFERHGFECLEFSTPGILDVDIVKKAISDGAHADIPKFIKYLLKNRSGDVQKEFQEFLQRNLLSSYGRILLRKI
jgi:Zn ribbon nucleic-acid-binding protein